MVPRGPDEQAIAEAASEIHSPDERAAYLDRACGSDGELRRRVEERLQSLAETRRIASPGPGCGRESSSGPSTPCAVSGDPAITPAPHAEGCASNGEALADARMMGLVKVADMLTGKDPACKGYIRAYRKGTLAE